MSFPELDELSLVDLKKLKLDFMLMYRGIDKMHPHDSVLYNRICERIQQKERVRQND